MTLLRGVGMSAASSTSHNVFGMLSHWKGWPVGLCQSGKETWLAAEDLTRSRGPRKVIKDAAANASEATWLTFSRRSCSTSFRAMPRSSFAPIKADQSDRGGVVGRDTGARCSCPYGPSNGSVPDLVLTTKSRVQL
jgi:hypothetical protein